jgi:hypothetical protein
MDHSWSLREELTASSQRWYVVLIFIFIGVLVGAGISWLAPAPYQASSDIYVGLDVYRAMRDLNVPIEPEGANDYKNWQMEDLEFLLFSQPVLDSALKALRQEDPYWDDVNSNQMGAMLNLYWRNAGKWRLTANHPQARYARQAVIAWKETAVPFIQNAVEQSRQVLVLDAQIQATAAEQAQALACQSQVDNLSGVLQKWATTLSGISSSDPLNEQSRWEFQDQLAGAASGLPAPDGCGLSGVTDIRLLAGGMPAGATASEFLVEIQRTLTILQAASGSQQAQANRLETTLAELKERYSTASQTSYSLSANLIIEDSSNSPPKIIRLRPTGQMILTGAILGLAAWMIHWLSGGLRARNGIRTASKKSSESKNNGQQNRS